MTGGRPGSRPGAAREDVADPVDRDRAAGLLAPADEEVARPRRRDRSRASRQTPPFSVAPICASSIRLAHSRSPLIVRLRIQIFPAPKAKSLRRPALLLRPDPDPWSRVASHVAPQAPDKRYRKASAARPARARVSRAMRVHLFRHRSQLAAARTNSSAPQCLPQSSGLAVRRPTRRCRARDARASAGELRREFVPGPAVPRSRVTLHHRSTRQGLLRRRGRVERAQFVERFKNSVHGNTLQA